ncbi:MAG: peptidylprolyl isomerase [Deltaproteobacteria bacterium]|nr:peptidylprolyl isomerase [Deltaproteobacteria bacterium]
MLKFLAMNEKPSKSHITSGSVTVFLFCVFAILFAVGCSKGIDQAKQESDRRKTLVVVGAMTITVGDFEDALHRLIPEGQEELTVEEVRELKKSLIFQMIEEELIVQEAHRRGLKIGEDELAGELKAIEDEYTGETFNDVIKSRYGALEKWKDEIKRKLIIRKLVDNIMETEVEVNSKEARAYYNENKVDYEMPEKVRARMIVVETEEEANKLKAELTRNNFAELAIKHSIGHEASKGGDLGFFAKGDMPLEFEEMVFNLKTGAISDILKTPYGYHIFKLEGKKQERKLSYSAAKASIMEKLKREKADKLFTEIMANLKQTTRIDIYEELL